MTLVDIALLNAALAERDAAQEENARLRAAVADARDAAERRIRIERDTSASWSPTEAYNDALYIYRSEIDPTLRAALAVPTADDGAERGAK